MGLASVTADIAPLYHGPSVESGRVDEELFGMSVQMIQQDENGWCYIRSEHSTEGYTPASCLDQKIDVATAWRKYKKATVLAPYIDIQKLASYTSARICSVPRGGIVVPLGKAGLDGWQKVGTPTGDIGYTRSSYIGDVITDWSLVSESDMRWNLVETALSYNGTAYRAGGRTPFGIDEVGLAAMTYLINGATIWREKFFKAGLAVHQIDAKKMGEGDLLFFPDTVGIYIGDQRFVHATTQEGTEGVIVSSLRAKDKDYRADLAGHIVAVASLF